MLVVMVLVALLPTPRARAAGTIEFGAAPSGYDDGRIVGLSELEGQLGRPLDFVRVFELWDSPFPTVFHNELVTNGQRMLLSVRARRSDGSFVAWRDIADAQPGSQVYDELVAWVQKIGALGVPVWFTFNHEPEVVENTANGTDQDFIDAWRRVVAEFAAQGVTNVSFVWVMTDYSFAVGPSDRRYAPLWYPGDDVVDYIGADPYNYASCRPLEPVAWRSLEDMIKPLRQFGAQHPDKGLILAEWASTEMAGDGGAAKAAWIDDAQTLFKTAGWDQFVAISYFVRTNPAQPGCLWPADSTATALAALQAMASDSFYGGDTPVNAPPLVSFTGLVDGSSVSSLVTVGVSADDPDGVAQVEFLINGTSLGVDTDGSDGWSVDWDTTTWPEGQDTITAIATDTLGASADDTISVVVDNYPPASITLVVGDPAALNSGEMAVINRWETNGYDVTVIDDNQITAATADNTDLIVVSSTASWIVADTFKTTTTPVWISKPWLLDDQAMTGPTSGTDYGTTNTNQLTITNPTHPLAAGYTGTITITPTPRSTQYGQPGPDATTIATTTNGTPVIFIYQPGTQLADNTTTPGCRIAFSIYQTQPTDFTTTTWTLFDTTTTYATTSCEPAPVNNPPTVSFTGLVDGSSVSSLVTVGVSADDPDGVAQVEFLINGTSLGVDTDGSDGWSVDWDTTTWPEGQDTITAIATDTLGASADDTISVVVDNYPPASITLVVGDPAALNSGEMAVINRWETNGYDVTVIDDNQITAATADNTDLIVVSSTASWIVADTFKTTTTPVWISKPWLLDDQAMTGPTSGTDYGTTNTNQLTITNPTHPLAAGYTGTITITPTPRSTQYGQPGPDATTIATTTNGTPVIFIYQPGTQLADNTTTPGCRIAFSIYQTQPTDFTTTTWTLFDTTTTYATTGCGG